MSYEPKLTKKEKEEKYKYLMALFHGGNHPKFDYEPYNGYYVGLENESDVVTWKKWLAFPPMEQEIIKQKWISYYKDSWNTYAAERFKQISIAFHLGDIAFVKEFSKKEYNISSTLKKPSSIDPDILYQHSLIKKWYEVKQILKEMDAEGMDQDLLKKASEIFGGTPTKPPYWNK